MVARDDLTATGLLLSLWHLTSKPKVRTLPREEGEKEGQKEEEVEEVVQIGLYTPWLPAVASCKHQEARCPSCTQMPAYQSSWLVGKEATEPVTGA